MRFTPFDPLLDLTPGITLLEASAGTGKTYSITSLFLRLVAEVGLLVDEILMVTFTRAATAELKDRIRQRLREAVLAFRKAGRDPALVEGLQDPVLRHLAAAQEPERSRRLAAIETALARMDDAAISTIHGFCQRMLQRHPIEARVDMDALVVEDDRDLREEVCDDLYVSTLNALDPDVARALREAGFRSALSALLAELSQHAEASPIPAAGVPPPDPAAWRAAFDALREEWARLGQEATAALQGAVAQGRLSRSSFRSTTIARAVASLENWQACPPAPFSELPGETKYFDKDYIVGATRKGQTPPEHPLFERVRQCRALADRLNLSFAAYRQGLAVRTMREVQARLAARKQEARVWSYQDLLVFLRDGLRDPRGGEALARAIRGQYRAALIDEFQDTDGVQWEVFRRVFDAPECSLFLIGDPKQAIYSFRGADIQAYLQARGCAARHLTLGVNWRSDGRWVRGLNTLYSRARRPFDDPGIEYVPVSVPPEHEEDRLRYPSQAHATIVIRYLPREAYGVAGTAQVTKGDLGRDVPWVVAGDIARLLLSGAEVRDRQGWRRLVPRDIAVLVRKHRQAWAVQRALARHRIPAVLHGEASVFQSEAASDLAQWLSAVVDPEGREAVRTAAVTSLFGLGVPEALEMEAREADWSALVEDLRRWRDLWREHGFSRMFRAMLHERSVLARLLAREGGERLATDLLHLAELLQVAATDSGAGPEALLAWFLRERTDPTDSSDTRQLRLESDEDAVEVVTMHHAKGLEYPVVFCPYLWDGHIMEEKAACVRFHDQGRILVAVRALTPPEEWKKRQDAAVREVASENLRLAYVAITRARHQCFLYHAPGTGHEKSPLAWLLFPAEDSAMQGSWRPARMEVGPESGVRGRGSGVAGPGLDPSRPDHPARPLVARSAALDDAACLAELRALSEASGGTIAVEAVDLAAPAPRYRPAQREVPALRAASLDRADLDRAWQWTSFTRIVAERGSEEPGDDEPGSAPPGEAQDGDALLRDFPRGRVPGQCLHRVFEALDFACEDPEPMVRRALAEYGLDADALARGVTEAVRATLDTPLPSQDGPLRLADVPMSDRMNEVSFLLPLAGGLRAGHEAAPLHAMARAFETHGGRLGPRYAAALRALPARDLRGFLSGQMDLVFRAGSRWYLVDYKSNDLGLARTDYAPEHLDDEIVSSYYFLQYHLYAISLARYGMLCVPGFDLDRDLGGVFYLFVRGLDGSGRTGVFHDRPTRALLDALSRVLDGRTA